MTKTTAQIACEAIINHPADGWSLDDAEAVLADAREHGVAPLYVDMLAETVAMWKALDVSDLPIAQRPVDYSDEDPCACRHGQDDHVMTAGPGRAECGICECPSWRAACEGHESLAGEHMGETVFCDGSCKP
jgi:hypothetical protein